MSGLTQKFGVGSKLKLRAHALTRLDGVPMPHDYVQGPERVSHTAIQSKVQTSSFPPHLFHPSRSCQPRTPMISSIVSWVLETQCPALLSGLLRTVTAASLKICPQTPRIPLHTMGWPPPQLVAISRSLARGSAPPTILFPTTLPSPLGQWPKCSRPLWP